MLIDVRNAKKKIAFLSSFLALFYCSIFSLFKFSSTPGLFSLANSIAICVCMCCV